MDRDRGRRPAGLGQDDDRGRDRRSGSARRTPSSIRCGGIRTGPRPATRTFRDAPRSRRRHAIAGCSTATTSSAGAADLVVATRRRVVWLDLGRWVTVPRVVRRTFTRAACADGAVERATASRSAWPSGPTRSSGTRGASTRSTTAYDAPRDATGDASDVGAAADAARGAAMARRASRCADPVTRGVRQTRHMTPEETVADACPKIRDLGWAFYFAPETLARGKELGLDGLRFYVIGRGGVLGDVESPVIAERVRLLRAGARREDVDVGEGEGRATRSRRARTWSAAPSSVAPRFAGVADLDAFCAAADAVNDAADPVGLALYSGIKSEPLADDLPARAMQLLTVLREFRGSAHLIAIRAVGLDAKTAHFIRRPADIGMFGWNDADAPAITDVEVAKLAAADDAHRPARAPRVLGARRGRPRRARLRPRPHRRRARELKRDRVSGRAAAAMLSPKKPGASSGSSREPALARVVGERIGRALGVRVVAAAHEDVGAADLTGDVHRQLVRERRHPHLTPEVLARRAARARAANGR